MDAVLKLRDYQQAALDGLYDYWATGRGDNPLIVAPTGAGKSLLIAKIIEDALSFTGTRVLVLTHVAELLRQNRAELHNVLPFVDSAFYSAGIGQKNLEARVIFGGIQSIWKRAFDMVPAPDLCIVDEAHLIPKNTETRYGKFLADLRIANPDMKLIGLTATPYRLDSGYLHEGDGALFDGIAYDIPVGKLIDDGWLAPVVAKAGKREIDLTDVHIRGGEFIESELAAAASDPELVRAVVSEIIAKGADRKSWLVFASGVDHAHMIQAEMTAQGEESVVITGDLNKTDRASRIEDFKHGDVRCLINVNVLTTGFNHPPIDLVAMVRATMSAGLYVQMVGRGMRTAPGKEDCLLLDYGSNVLRHGFIDRVRPKDKSASQGGDAPAKKCPDCEALLPTAVLECPSCGHKFPPPERKHGKEAYNGAVVSTQVQAEWVDVDSVTYARHQKAGKPDSIRVTYHCGMMDYREWLCPDHGGFAASKYRARMKSLEADATTTDAALAEAPLFWIMPSRIKIRPRADDPKWHEIVQLDYTGGRKPKPRGESIDWTNPNAWNDLIRTDYDDEIPF